MPASPVLVGWVHDVVAPDLHGAVPIPDVAMSYTNPEDGSTIALGRYVGCFIQRATLFNPLGAVRATGRVPSTIEMTLLPTTKQ
jgi:hypothetical protein